MAMEKEALTHKIEDDLAARNRNWDKIDTHLAESATDDVHGLRDRVIEGNGDGYMMFGNGIVVMWGQVVVDRISSAQNVSIQWNYPIPLIDKPQTILATIQAGNVTSAATFDRIVIDNQATTNNVASALLSTNSNTMYTFRVNFFAIGRWKD